MTPATAAFTDGALVVGQSYTDSTYNFTVNVTAATPTLLTLQVVTGAGRGHLTPSPRRPIRPCHGGYVLLTATVTGAGASPIGTVAFTDGASTIANCGSVALNASGVATCFAYLMAVGSPHAIKATYSGSIGYAGSSATVSQVVNKAATKTHRSPRIRPTRSTSARRLRSPRRLAVTSPGSGTPTGTITVSDGTANCFITLPATGCSLVPLTSGTKTLTATYAGDVNYITSTSAGVSHTVNTVVTAGHVHGRSRRRAIGARRLGVRDRAKGARARRVEQPGRRLAGDVVRAHRRRARVAEFRQHQHRRAGLCAGHRHRQRDLGRLFRHRDQRRPQPARSRSPTR